MTTAIVENGKLYYGAFVMDAATATPVCVHPEYAGSLNPGDLFYDLPLIDGVLYISTSSSVVAFDTVACQPRWEYQPQARVGGKRPRVVSNPAVLNGIVYAIFSDATLRAINQQSGQEIGYWQAEAVKYSRSNDQAIPGVVASNDMLIASFGNGQLYAFGP
jgi:outer membrane protein assembly factor BamB